MALIEQYNLSSYQLFLGGHEIHERFQIPKRLLIHTSGILTKPNNANREGMLITYLLLAGVSCTAQEMLIEKYLKSFNCPNNGGYRRAQPRVGCRSWCTD